MIQLHFRVCAATLCLSSCKRQSDVERSSQGLKGCSPLNDVSDKAAVIVASLIHPSIFNRLAVTFRFCHNETLAVAFASSLQRTPTGPAILQPAEKDSD